MQKWKVGYGVKYSNLTCLFRFSCVSEEHGFTGSPGGCFKLRKFGT